MITVRKTEETYLAEGDIQNGTFQGRWHFSFGEYYDPQHKSFGMLRVFNDDTLSPGAVWPLHPHRDIEVVTYCAAGEFRHADQCGEGGVLKKHVHASVDMAPNSTVKRVWRCRANDLRQCT
jgi:redox-sensitive bicupin YhaK (pirin superfamily)